MELKMSSNIKRMLDGKENFVLDKSGIDNNVINLAELRDSDELIAKLMATNSLTANERRDKMAIQRYLELKKQGIKSMHYYFPQPNAKMNIFEAIQYGDESGMMISGHEKAYTPLELQSRGKFDYRITMRGSSEIITEEAKAFTNAVVSEANKRNLNIRMKDPWTHDAVILYIDKEELLETVKMLEDLKDATRYGELVSRATQHFGPTIAFGAVVNSDNYYGISMAHSELQYGREPSKLMGSYGGGFGNTFGRYMEDECLDKAYDELSSKYNGDISRITVDEMYPMIIKKHREYMLGDKANDDIPLWMNRRNYLDAKKIVLNKEPRLTGTLLRQIEEKKKKSGFYIPTDFDLDDNQSGRHR